MHVQSFTSDETKNSSLSNCDRHEITRITNNGIGWLSEATLAMQVAAEIELTAVTQMHQRLEASSSTRVHSNQGNSFINCETSELGLAAGKTSIFH